MEKSKLYVMPFSRIYPLYVAKAVRKGRTKDEVDEIIRWMTGYSQGEIELLAGDQTRLEDFFTCAPTLNPHRKLVTGVICGVRVEDIKDPIMQEIRCLDKLIDELSKGRPMEKILRKPAQTSA